MNFSVQNMILFKWSVELHNKVNHKLQKSQFTYQEALDKWIILI